jgi:hypothetical protein
MAKRYFKNLKIIGRVFCLYNTRETGYFTLYVFDGKFYFKPRKQAIKGKEVNGVKNMVPATPCNFGTVSGYQETN